MTAPAADANLMRLGHALHDLATAIDATEHAGLLIHPGQPSRLRGDVAAVMGMFRLRVNDLQRDLEFLQARQ